MILINVIHLLFIWSVDADLHTAGVGLSKSQLNEFTKHFVQSTKEKPKIGPKLSSSPQNFLKSKRYNFSSPFLLEDRLLLVRLYNKYTEENCMTFKKFAQKFRKTANEWDADAMEMWEKRKGRVLESIEGIDSFDDLEKMTEKELLEVLLSLESETDSDNAVDAEFTIPDNVDEARSELNRSLSASELQTQEQEQSQQVLAEIHTHSHYYLLQGQDGSVQELPELADKDPSTVQQYLNNTSQNTITSLNSDVMEPTVTSPFSTVPNNNNVENNESSGSGSTPASSSDTCMCPSATMSSYDNMYQVDNSQLSTDFITLTTSTPLEASFASTVSQTTLPPVEIPSNSTAAEVSSLPAELPPRIPTPENRNGVFTCGTSSSGVTTNFVNPSYPDYDSSTGSCQFHLVLHSDVCQVRVDFVDTALLPPVEGECSLQSLTVGGTVWPLGVKSFCGVNSDQHFYIETADSEGGKYVEFEVNTEKSSDYKWGLWITQIFCDGTRTIQAPTGCFQYHFDYSGIIQSFNYAGGQYFNDQHYRICILASSDACQIDYRAEGEFMLEKWGNYKTNPYTRAGVTSQYCVRDYLQIPGGFGGADQNSHDRFCGGELSANHGARTSQPVVTKIKSRLATLEFHSGTPEGRYKSEHHSPGFRVRYQQMACI